MRPRPLRGATWQQKNLISRIDSIVYDMADAYKSGMISPSESSPPPPSFFCRWHHAALRLCFHTAFLALLSLRVRISSFHGIMLPEYLMIAAATIDYSYFLVSVQPLLDCIVTSE